MKSKVLAITVALSLGGAGAAVALPDAPAPAKASGSLPFIKPAGADFSGVWNMLPQHPRDFDPQAGMVRENPPLKPEWMAEWLKTRQRKDAGMRIWDPAIHCLPPGMPHMMNGSYPFEVLMTPGRVTVLTELFNETRRIWTDGRQHPPADELEYTFDGHSIGHWEGATLVIDTVGLRPETVIDVAAVPHSDQLHVTERVHLVSKDALDWTITLEDPVVLDKPWTETKHFTRAPATDGIREYACADNKHHDDKYAPSPDDDKYTHVDPRLKTQQ